MIIRKKLRCFYIGSAVLLIAACTTNVNRGHLKEDEAMTHIKVGVTTKAEVVKELGSPSSESTFGDKRWYYVSTIRQTRSILPPKILEQHTTEIAFNSSDVVVSMKEYTLEDGKNIEIDKRITPTEGQQLGFFEQIFSNLGRFNKDNSGASNSHGHSTTGGAPTGYPGR